MTELDIRIQILNSFLSTPHGKLADLAPLHTAGLDRDPLFYAHLAAWYAERGEVRDHKVLFVAHLLTSDFSELREVGWMLLQKLPPHMVAAAQAHAKRTIGKMPRTFKSAVAAYLRALELHPERFDRAAMRSRKDLKQLYASLRIAPGSRAQAVLFAEQPPEGSPLAQLKTLARASDPAEQARIIVEQRIPYTTAVGAIKTITPSVLVALIDVMTPQETINHLKALKERGAFDSPEVKALVEAKLKAAEGDKRVSTLKATRAMANVALDESTTVLLTEVTDKRVAKIARINRPTALFVDKSSSMTQAIEVAKEVAAMVSAICSDFRVLAFDSDTFEVTARGTERSAWEQAFKLIRADGSTSIGAPLAKLGRERHYVEQLIIITDMGENTHPYLHDAYAEYVRTMGNGPSITIVAVGGSDRTFLTNMQRHDLPHTIWNFSGDFYSLPNLLPLLAMPSRAELVEQVMAVPLPARAA
ncbi:MAG: hypothetical protein MUD01_03815 [Chloroflexaceae bacterium]|nr:hypothetical protein [Chloroflexaceae bacterium]